MKFIYPSVEVLPELYNREGIYKAIERGARVAYQSQDKITEESADKLVDFLIAKKHLEPCELGSVYLYLTLASPIYDYDYIKKTDVIKFYDDNPYSRVVRKENNYLNLTEYYITANYRTLIEHNRLKDLEFYALPTEHIRRITVRFVTSIGITRDFIRHRAGSFVNESTRYCNYSLGKYGNEVTFIIPRWSNISAGSYSITNNIVYTKYGEEVKLSEREILLMKNCYNSQQDYLAGIELGMKAQEARDMLNLATSSELIMCMFEDDWKHFFELRSPLYGATGTNPEYAYLADELYKQFQKLGYL